MKRQRIHPRDEAERIEALLKSELTRKLNTHDPVRLATFVCDGMKCATNLRLLTYSPTYSR